VVLRAAWSSGVVAHVLASGMDLALGDTVKVIGKPELGTVSSAYAVRSNHRTHMAVCRASFDSTARYGVSDKRNGLMAAFLPLLEPLSLDVTLRADCARLRSRTTPQPGLGWVSFLGTEPVSVDARGPCVQSFHAL
jgi:hypothetical protein